MKFKLKSEFKPIKDQENAINLLSRNYTGGTKYQVLLGVTGSGKTFTVANLIDKLQLPTLIISHNKTLAAQLYQEFKSFFPENAVSYFVSYYDYYQPESYIPSTDTYIEKDADINEAIDRLRLLASTNILSRNDTVVVASVSCIYNIGSPVNYERFVINFSVNSPFDRTKIIEKLVELQYERGDFGFHRGTFRLRGPDLDIYPAYEDVGIKISTENEKITGISVFDPTSGNVKNEGLKSFNLYPAKHFITDPQTDEGVFKNIQKDLETQVQKLKAAGKELEAMRLKQRVTYDIEMIKEVGYVKGIENYSRYFDGRKPGDPPYSLIDYYREKYGKNWLCIIDESHMTFPQIRGMYNGDFSRKQTLIDYGFRLPSALDNRPLKFDEFTSIIPNFIATSATPSDWEIKVARLQSTDVPFKSAPEDKESYSKIHEQGSVNGSKAIVEQLLRPTGIPDPKVTIKPVTTQVMESITEIKVRAARKERVLVTTLTKKIAEDLTDYLKNEGIAVQYLHSDVETLERSNILDNLRSGSYDVIVGVNLLREGLDLPEVSLVLILDADKEGFLRSEVSLIQTMGRAARNKDGEVILFADKMTGSIERALKEVERRREYQLMMNKKLGIIPRTVSKPIREKLISEEEYNLTVNKKVKAEPLFLNIESIEPSSYTPMDKKKLIKDLRAEMKEAAGNLDFELAIKLRDKARELESS